MHTIRSLQWALCDFLYTMSTLMIHFVVWAAAEISIYFVIIWSVKKSLQRTSSQSRSKTDWTHKRLWWKSSQSLERPRPSPIEGSQPVFFDKNKNILLKSKYIYLFFEKKHQDYVYLYFQNLKNTDLNPPRNHWESQNSVREHNGWEGPTCSRLAPPQDETQKSSFGKRTSTVLW